MGGEAPARPHLRAPPGAGRGARPCSRGNQGGPKEWGSQVTTGLIVFYSRFVACSDPHVDRCSDPLPFPAGEAHATERHLPLSQRMFTANVKWIFTEIVQGIFTAGLQRILAGVFQLVGCGRAAHCSGLACPSNKYVITITVIAVYSCL